MQELDPSHCALLLVSSMVIAGCAQTAWFRYPGSERWAFPLDGGATLRGRRIFGENKTLRGLIVVVPCGAAACALLGWLLLASELSIWSMPLSGYALLGAAAALGMMLGELPNSFIKRQLDVAPGQPPRSSRWRAVGFIVDRLDSVLGALLLASLVVNVSWVVWLWVLLIGPPIHWTFSVALFWLGVKRRPA